MKRRRFHHRYSTLPSNSSTINNQSNSYKTSGQDWLRVYSSAFSD